MQDRRSALRIPLLPLLLGAASTAALACFRRLAAGPGDPGGALAWLDALLEHPWRSTLAFGLLWLAALARPGPPEGAPRGAPPPGEGRSGGLRVGRSASAD